MLQKVKINSVQVKPIVTEEYNPKEIRGYDLFEKPYPNVFIPAMTASGKTSLIWTIIRKKCDKKTKFICFVGTHEQDDSWMKIKEWMDANDIYYEFYYSIYEDNALEGLIQDLRDERKREEEERIKMEHPEEEENAIVNFKEHSVQIKVKKPRKIAPAYCLIFDDLAKELRDPKISFLAREIRHYHAMGIYSSQTLNDIHPQALTQMRYILILKGLNKIKLEELYRKLSLPLTWDQFRLLYSDATKEKYNFLWINVDGAFRKNFDMKYVLN